MLRPAVLALVFATAACAPDTKAPIAVPAVARASTLDVNFVDTIDGANATHVAVGGRVRVRVADPVTAMLAYGPFAISHSTDDMLAIVATGAGSGEIEIETATGYARFAVTSAPIDDVTMAFDATNPRHATIVLRDAQGKRLVDANLRIASGSAPVTFVRGAWDQIVFETLPPGDVFVKTDLLGATHAMAAPSACAHGTKVATAGTSARR
jgi:hypothetical protein